MTPNPPRRRFWPYAALPAGLAFAFVAVSAGQAQEDKPAPPHRNPDLAALFSSQFGGRPLPPHPEVQICYRIRYIDCEEQTWRLHKEWVRPCGPDSDPRGGLIGNHLLGDLVLHLMDDPTASMLQFPNVTAFQDWNVELQPGKDEGASHYSLTSRIASARAGILSRSWTGILRLVAMPNSTADGAPRKRSRGLADLRQRIMHTPGTRLAVDLQGPMLTSLWDGREGGPADKAPAPGEIRYKGSCDLPADFSMLIDLGRFERLIGSRSVPSKRLVVITPQHLFIDNFWEAESVPESKTR